jgi:hypothetical protein
VTVCRSGLDDDHPRQRLLPTVYDLALRLGADSRRKQPTVRLGQTGRMRQLGASHWMAFRAEQAISNLHCAFDWRARTGPFRLVSVRDALTEGGGRFEVRALGFIPIAGAIGSPALTRGELMRYLAELAWAPDAILLNTELRWREDGPDKLVVGAGSGETAAEVVLSLDSEGRIAGAFAPDRPRAVKAPFLPTPWSGRFSDYRRHNDMWLPFAGEVGWVIDGEEAVYWEGQIEHWES